MPVSASREVWPPAPELAAAVSPVLMIGTGVSGFIWVGSCVWGACKQERCVASIAEGPGVII